MQNTKEVKYLIWAGIGALIMLAFFLLVTVNRTLDTATTTNTVSFSGQGKVATSPNVAIIDVSIVTSAKTSKEAQNENSKKSQSLTKFLENQNINEKDIKTTGYNIYPQYSYPRPITLEAESKDYPEYYDSNPKITSYQVNQTIQVKVRDLEKVDTILDGVVAAGVNQINNLQLTVDEPEKLKEQAREKAIADAKTKASNLQNQLGIRLGRIVNFSEDTGGYPIPMMYAKEAIGMGGGGTVPSVPTGENEITVNITITYQIR